jgi:hypothetical protein
MTFRVKRPPVAAGAGRGLLRHDNFQIAYATNDLERARQVFAERYGIRQFRANDGQLAGGASVRVELAWVGGMMYELIYAHGPGSEFINDMLTPGEFSLRHHHNGFFVYDETEWQALEREAEEGGYRILQKACLDGFLRVFYVEAPELGHYLEYIFPEPAGVTFFENVPRS